MFVAHVDGSPVPAEPGGKGTCPGCSCPVVAKCGEIVCWHWAHVVGEDCDSWTEPDTAWHRDWQAGFPLDRVEVVMGPHRADALTCDNRVIEFQHSALSVDEIRERETFYGLSMIWVFNGIEAYEQDRFLPRHDPRRGIWTFRWKQARKSIGACRANVMLDLGDGRLFEIRRLHGVEAPVGGWGRMLDKDEFLGWFAHGGFTRAAAPLAF